MESLAGVRPALSGRVMFRGEDVTNRPAHHGAARGLRYVPSAPHPFPGFTVFDHVLLGAGGGFGDLGARSRREAAQRALPSFPALGERARQSASMLADGERLLLAIAQALAGGPALLLFGDPLARVPATIGDALLQFLETARASGTAILFADAVPARSLSVADRG
ncbi:MAG: ATP-binding cassette domain-containing protein [Armatimonadetes bacterium]|nr:ATP-binding cassette domain-containing protein [Armatimonadota bacterium]